MGHIDSTTGKPYDELVARLRSYHDADPPLSEAALSELMALATPMRGETGHRLTRQYAPADAFYLLVHGEVRFQLELEGDHQDLDVGTSDAAWTPVGWSGFRPPGRYATTVVCVGPCLLLHFDHGALHAFFDANPRVGIAFLTAVVAGSLDLLTTMRDRLSAIVRVPSSVGHTLDPHGEEEAYNRAPPALPDLLRRSAFFEVFDESQLTRLSEGAESQYCCRGESVLEQGGGEAGLWVLATGRVAVHYRASDNGQTIPIRSLSSPGAIVGWAGFGGIDTHPASVVATRDCTVYRLDSSTLRALATNEPSLAFAVTRRLLWLVSNYLRSARALFISQQFEQEILAIRNLLEQSCTQLSVSSPLHRLPHLLRSAYTLSDAFTCLEQMSRSGDSLERSVAQVCLDILGEVRREHEMFEALRRVYHAVVTAPSDMSPREVRKLCAEGFREAFGGVRYVVEGREHLPPTPGHIFIFNHLKNHEYNTLPNNFQLTLDSHFVSSMILDPHYGDSGIRVVRKSRGTEYGHQNYYDRLGHISVYTKESDELRETAAEKQARRNDFFDIAGAQLRAGVNLIVSPEGTSYWTEDSPGPFKPGAFRLAASVEPEPLIVPLAVANFDRRVHSTVYAALIKPPFKVSTVVKDPWDPHQLRGFLREYEKTYAEYVAEARELARESRPGSGG